jgi:protein-disulfide isomerase
MRNRRPILIGIPIIALALVAGLILAQRSSDSSSAGGPVVLQDVAAVTSHIAGVPEKAGVLGFADAPVTITEFGDLRCPVCRQFDLQTVPDVIEQQVKTHKAKLAFEHWAILGPNSIVAGKAAFAARQQDRMWAFTLITYANQGDETKDWFTDAFAHAAADAAGLDRTAFDAARASKDATAYLSSIDAQAAGRGFTGTPTILVKGPTGEKVLDSVPDAAAIGDAVKAVGGS